MSSRCHSAKALSTTVGNSIVAMVTGIWHHITYDLRGAWHTVYAMLPSNNNLDADCYLYNRKNF